jgi:hypothetical protein
MVDFLVRFNTSGVLVVDLLVNNVRFRAEIFEVTGLHG